MLAQTPAPPYWAVIFTSIRADADHDLYAATAARMMELAQSQPGFLGIDSAREAAGITVSYWESEEAIKAWHAVAEHREAQRLGYERFYDAFQLRVARVERAYAFQR